MHARMDQHVMAASALPPAWVQGRDMQIPDSTIADLVEHHACLQPDAIAATSDGRTLTYQELFDASTAVAGALVADGVHPGDRVAVLMERSVDLVIALLAVWRAGAVYVPLDPEHPAERVAYLVRDSGAVTVLTRLIEGPPLRESVRRQAMDPAYLIYTSGSTGQPKAVEVAHGSLMNVIGELTESLEADAQQRWLTMAPAAFDISMAELCLPLATGARVTITSGAEVRDAARTVRLIAELGITRMQAVPSQWQALVDAGLRAPGLLGMVGGEALPPALARELTARLRGLVNGYGPTETTVLSTLWRVPRDAEEITIGRPIANTRVALLDDDRMPVPPGEVGELYIAGAGVALGYAGDPELTARAFPPDPLVPGARMYRTGDRCRWTLDGKLAYVGRTDGQVKVRGQRIELGEVESALARCPGVAAAAAAVRGQSLVAYVVPTGNGLAPAEVRDFAAATLPAGMVPNIVVLLDAFPLTANGKIDRSALPEPQTTSVASGPAVDGFEGEFFALVARVLGVGSAGPGDDFFELGGHSLAVMRTAAAIQERWRVEVPSEVFYDAQTLADLAAAVDDLRLAVR
jgi:amino acid adenylation domain-containing protein